MSAHRQHYQQQLQALNRHPRRAPWYIVATVIFVAWVALCLAVKVLVEDSAAAPSRPAATTQVSCK